MTVERQLRGRRDVVLDTTVWIYLFEDHSRYGPLCEKLLAAVGAGVFSAVVTPITAAEVLVKPVKERRPDIADRYRVALRTQPNVRCVAFDEESGFVAGALRAAYGAPLPDMLQAAAALRAPRPTLVSNDKAMKRIREVDVLLLDDWL